MRIAVLAIAPLLILSTLPLTAKETGKKPAPKQSIPKDFEPGDYVAVTASVGNIYYTQGGKTRRLTATGRDCSPMLLLDYQTVAFLRHKKRFSHNKGVGCTAEEIWTIKIATGATKRVVKSKSSDKPEKNFGPLGSYCESFDGKALYVLSNAWTTSDALWRVDLRSGKARFICPANSIKVVSFSTNRDEIGKLVISQHRYFAGSGSYDWYYLFTPESKEIAPIGDTIENFVKEHDIRFK